MAVLNGFWSYVHVDDEAERGRIASLARDVSSQFEMLTGEAIELFLDKDAIEWGQNWRERIDNSLATVAFFIPVMTPRYFKSPECRRELQFFARQATKLGVKELVLPLLYVDVPGIHDEMAGDDLLEMVRNFQWEDWRDLRFAELDSEEYRRGVARLAGRLVEANRLAEQVDLAPAARQFEEESEDALDDESPGVIDQIVKAEEALPKWQVALTAMGKEIELIGQAMQEATAEVQRGDATAKGFGHRLASARRLARRLEEPTENIKSFGNDFASQLHDVDEGFRIIIQRAPDEIEKDPSSKSQVCGFFEIVRLISTSAAGAFNSIREMIDSVADLEKLSRDLRPTLRRLRSGLTVVLEAREVTEEWVRLIEMSGVECE